LGRVNVPLSPKIPTGAMEPGSSNLDTGLYLPQHLLVLCLLELWSIGSSLRRNCRSMLSRTAGSGCGQTSVGPLQERSMTPPAQASDLAQPQGHGAR
jgi:hypothetical protein